MSFGPHLLFSLGECQEVNKLRDENFIKSFLLSLVDICKMTLIMGPTLHKFQGDSMEEDGISGIVVIAESHISIHTAPEHRTCSIDIFSCKEFDYWNGIAYIMKELRPNTYFHEIIDRGKHFPKTKFFKAVKKENPQEVNKVPEIEK